MPAPRNSRQAVPRTNITKAVHRATHKGSLKSDAKVVTRAGVKLVAGAKAGPRNEPRRATLGLPSRAGQPGARAKPRGGARNGPPTQPQGVSRAGAQGMARAGPKKKAWAEPQGAGRGEPRADTRGKPTGKHWVEAPPSALPARPRAEPQGRTQAKPWAGPQAPLRNRPIADPRTQSRPVTRSGAGTFTRANQAARPRPVAVGIAAEGSDAAQSVAPRGARRPVVAKAVNAAAASTINVEVAGEFIELNHLLKLAGLATSGGSGKAMVAAGGILVDGVEELRKTRKVREGQIVSVGALRIRVVAAVPVVADAAAPFEDPTAQGGADPVAPARPAAWPKKPTRDGMAQHGSRAKRPPRKLAPK